MAVIQIVVPTESHDFETAVETTKYIACGDQDIFVAERDAAQTWVAAAALEVNLARVPVEELLNLLRFKVDRKYAAVILTLPAAAHNGCCDKLW